jgi:hypothetical protein
LPEFFTSCPSEYPVPATYCTEPQLPLTDELEGAMELDERKELLEGATLDGCVDEREEDEGAIELDEATPSQLPNRAHSCH